MANIGGDTMEKRLEARSRLQPYFVNISTTWWWNDKKKSNRHTHTHTKKVQPTDFFAYIVRHLVFLGMVFHCRWSLPKKFNRLFDVRMRSSTIFHQPSQRLFFFLSSTRPNFSLLTTAREKRDGIRKAYKRTNGQTAAMLNGSCHKSGHFQANFSSSFAT